MKKGHCLPNLSKTQMMSQKIYREDRREEMMDMM